MQRFGERGEGVRHLATDEDQVVGSRAVRRREHFAVLGGGNRAELEHVAQRDDQPGAAALRDLACREERGADRAWIRVVAVVENQHTRGLERAKPPGHGFDRGDRRRHPGELFG